MVAITIPINLPIPHDKQKDFISSPAKRKVIVAGRRGGKTTGVSMLAATAFLDNRRILYAAPTQEQTDAFWTAIKKYFAEPIANKYIYKNETERILQLGDARIRGKTAWNADTLRGDYADLLILEEWSLMEPSAWDEVGAPMLLDNNGDAVFIFTPKRRNHAYQTYQKAVQDDTGRWKAWHFTSLDNPHLSKEALAEITADMTDEAYRQEIMAEFLEGEGVVFRNIPACMKAPLNVDPKKHEGHNIVAGLDLAKQQDFTAISAGCVDCHEEIARDRYNKIDYQYQVKRISLFCKKWGVDTLLVDSTGVGDPVFEQLTRDLDGLVLQQRLD